MTEWCKRYSSAEVRPDELDTTSSQTTVYERKNIHQETFQDETSGIQYTQWVYDERTYSKEEYSNLTSPSFQLLMQNLSDLEVDIVSMGLGEEVL